MRYKNPDPFEKKLADQLVNEMWNIYNEKFADYVKRHFYNSLDAVLARELDFDTLMGLIKKCRARRTSINFDDIGTQELAKEDTRK